MINFGVSGNLPSIRQPLNLSAVRPNHIENELPNGRHVGGKVGNVIKCFTDYKCIASVARVGQGRNKRVKNLATDVIAKALTRA